VDNGSRDESVPMLREAIALNGWEEWVKLLPLEANQGFSRGNNLGIAALPGDGPLLLLNSDTRLHAGCLRQCLDALDYDSRVGALSCRLVEEGGATQTVARRFPTPIRSVVSALGLHRRCRWLFGWADVQDLGWDRTRVSKDVDWIGGAFMLIRGEALRHVGGLDERFFFYGEDVEFCWRLRRAGYRCRYECQPSVIHLGGGSSSFDSGPNDLNEQRWRARYQVQRICFGRWAEWLLRCVDACVASVRVLRDALWRRDHLCESKARFRRAWTPIARSETLL